MTPRQRRIAARLLALVFLAAFVCTLWRAITQPSAVFVADVVLYGGLAVLYGAIAREENRK